MSISSFSLTRIRNVIFTVTQLFVVIFTAVRVSSPVTASATDIYLRPNGVDQYYQPDGTSVYNRPV